MAHFVRSGFFKNIIIRLNRKYTLLISSYRETIEPV